MLNLNTRRSAVSFMSPLFNPQGKQLPQHSIGGWKGHLSQSAHFDIAKNLLLLLESIAWTWCLKFKYKMKAVTAPYKKAQDTQKKEKQSKITYFLLSLLPPLCHAMYIILSFRQHSTRNTNTIPVMPTQMFFCLLTTNLHVIKFHDCIFIFHGCISEEVGIHKKLYPRRK